jgi:hypothetical protein
VPGDEPLFRLREPEERHVFWAAITPFTHPPRQVAHKFAAATTAATAALLAGLLR